MHKEKKLFIIGGLLIVILIGWLGGKDVKES
jgi:hypothetical protein